MVKVGTILVGVPRRCMNGYDEIPAPVAIIDELTIRHLIPTVLANLGAHHQPEPFKKMDT